MLLCQPPVFSRRCTSISVHHTHPYDHHSIHTHFFQPNKVHQLYKPKHTTLCACTILICSPSQSNMLYQSLTSDSLQTPLSPSISPLFYLPTPPLSLSLSLSLLKSTPTCLSSNQFISNIPHIRKPSTWDQ